MVKIVLFNDRREVCLSEGVREDTCAQGQVDDGLRTGMIDGRHVLKRSVGMGTRGLDLIDSSCCTGLYNLLSGLLEFRNGTARYLKSLQRNVVYIIFFMTAIIWW